MKKTLIAMFALTALVAPGLKAQTIQEGKTHLYDGRVKTAIDVFRKMLEVNPNNIEASYWLGQAYLDMDEIMSARLAATKEHYTKAVQASNNAPLLQAGMGHIYLLEGKADEARLQFESALTLTRTKKGNDPAIVHALGRAFDDAKKPDYPYAIRLMEESIDKDGKTPEMLVVIGNLYRKANPGEGGSDAYKAYMKALSIDGSFVPALFRLAKMAENRSDKEQFLQYLNEAVTKNSRFTKGYYELFYYYFYRQKYPEAEEQLKKYIESKMAETEVSDQYLYAQLCWAKKDFECAVAKGESVVTALGDNTKPKVYRLLADAYFSKNDFANAKKYSDLFFQKKNPDDYISYDHKLRADILSRTGGTQDEIFSNYMLGAELDTTLADRIEFLKKGAAYFKQLKVRDREAAFVEKIIALKPKPSINDYFDLTTAYYFSNNYAQAQEAARQMSEKFPDQVFGYEWYFNSAVAIYNATDSLRRDSVSNALTAPAATKLYEFSQTDTFKFKKQYISSVRFLAGYYINVMKDKQKSVEFFKMWQSADPGNAAMIQTYIDQIEGQPTRPSKPAPPAKTGTGAVSPKSNNNGTGKVSSVPESPRALPAK